MPPNAFVIVVPEGEERLSREGKEDLKIGQPCIFHIQLTLRNSRSVINLSNA